MGELHESNRDGETIWALQDVSFTVDKGEVLGIIGRNGAGKSTLLKILSRVTAPTDGEIKVKGRIASLLEVGTGFHPKLTGRENIYLNGAILGMSKQEVQRKFDEIVNFAEVEKFIDTPVKRYSSGMYVRLAFAVAAHLESDILLVDEVLAVGDIDFQKKCLGKMGDVSTKEGRTVLFVSHNMGSVELLCNRGILFNNGQIYYSGTTTDTILNYYKAFKSSLKTAISLRKDRTGNGNIKLTDIRIKNRFGNVIKNLFLGDDFSIELDYETDTRIDLRSVEFTLVCSTSRDIKVFMQKKVFQNQRDVMPIKGTLTFSPEKNILAPGDYYFRVVIRQKQEVCDRLDHAAMLIIESDRPNDSMTMYPSNWSGVCIIEGYWDFNQFHSTQIRKVEFKGFVSTKMQPITIIYKPPLGPLAQSKQLLVKILSTFMVKKNPKLLHRQKGRPGRLYEVTT